MTGETKGFSTAVPVRSLSSLGVASFVNSGAEVPSQPASTSEACTKQAQGTNTRLAWICNHEFAKPHLGRLESRVSSDA